MQEAFIEGLGTSVVAILIVFIVLTALCFVLYLLKFVNISETKKNEAVNKTEDIKSQLSVKTQDLEKKSNDTELIAVITAAIAATLGTTTDKLVVKSITKTQNWNMVAKREQQRNII